MLDLGGGGEINFLKFDKWISDETDVKKGTTTIGFNETSDTKKIVSLEDLSVQTPPQCQMHIQQSSGPGQQQNGAVKNQTLKQEVFKEKNEQETDENDST